MPSSEFLINIAIEQAILSSFINNCLETDLSNYIERLKPEDFYKHQHQKIFEVILELHKLNNPIDHNFVERKLDSEFHNDLLEILATNEITNLYEYIKILKDMSLRRKYLQFSHHIKHTIYDKDSSIEHIQEKIDSEYYKMITTSNPDNHNIQTAAEIIEHLHNHVLQNETTKIFTSLSSLDTLTGGFEEGDLIVIAARPAMGKSSFAATLETNFAMSGFGSFTASFEMSRTQWMTNILSIHSKELKNNIISNQIQNNKVYKNSVDFIKKSNIFIDDSTGVYWNKLSKTLRKFLKDNPNVKDIFIDHLGKILLPNVTRPDIEIGEITTGLKNIAKDFGVRIYLLHQLNRDPDKRTDKRPMLSDLKDSGCIEADADKILFLFNSDYYAKNEHSLVSAEIIVAKNRNGLTGTAKVMFDKTRALFYEEEKKQFKKVVNK